MQLITQRPEDRSASQLPVGAVISDADDDVFVKVAVNKWVDAHGEEKNDRDVEHWSSDPVTLLYAPNGDN